MKIRIGFFGTPELAASVLSECLRDSVFEVLFVVSQADKPVGRKLELTPSPVSKLATESGIPLFRPEKIRGNEEFMSALNQFEVDYIVVVAYGKILPKNILDIPKILPINVHGSILPKYRGASPIQSCLLAGEAETGVSIMRMDEGMDEGGVLSVFPIPIDTTETSETLFGKFAEVSPIALTSTLKKHFLGEIGVVEQDHAQATYTGKIEKSMGEIDWVNWTALRLFRNWQGYTPWPGIWTYLKGKRCVITSCNLIQDSKKIEKIIQYGIVENLQNPGAVISNEEGVFVFCSDMQPIEILEILIEGKPRRFAKDVLKNGDIFGLNY